MELKTAVIYMFFTSVCKLFTTTVCACLVFGDSPHHQPPHCKHTQHIYKLKSNETCFVCG